MSLIPPRKKYHTISIMVANKPGVLMRVSAIFARRAFNIESLVVSPALDGRYSRMTITAVGNPETLEQIIKQLSKLIDVVHAIEHPENCLEKELALIKVKADESTRTEILQIAQCFKGKTVDYTDKSIIIQMTGDTDKLDACVNLLAKFKILEIVRTGKILMTRGPEHT